MLFSEYMHSFLSFIMYCIGNMPIYFVNFLRNPTSDMLHSCAIWDTERDRFILYIKELHIFSSRRAGEQVQLIFIVTGVQQEPQFD